MLLDKDGSHNDFVQIEDFRRIALLKTGEKCHG